MSVIARSGRVLFAVIVADFVVLTYTFSNEWLRCHFYMSAAAIAVESSALPKYGGYESWLQACLQAV